MNKHCFRLIFSKPLGFLIPVAEITTAQRKPGQRQAPAASSVEVKPPAFSLKHLALSLLVAGVPSWAAAEILLDRSGATSVSSAMSGVPVIEIANLNMTDLHEARSAFDSVGSSGFFSQVDIIEMASSANSVGNTLNAKNLTVQAQGDWNIVGGEINADTSNVQVGGDMTVAAGKDLAFHEKTVKTTQLVISAGVGAGGYEANGMWGSAVAIDTHLPSPFDGLAEGDPVTPNLRGQASAGRSAASQALASQGTGGRTGANAGRGATSGANFKVGIETVTTTDTSESTTFRNAQLNLGSGSVDVGGTFDMGGADINAGYQLSAEERAKMTAEERIAATKAIPTLDVTAGDIKTTKFENKEKTTHTREELFLGITAEGHSSLVDVATQAGQLANKNLGTDAVVDPNAPPASSKTLATQEGRMEVDPALTAMMAAGLATQVAFGEAIGGSVTVGMQHTLETREAENRAQNINQIGGNISLTSTKGDIALNGVNLQGGKVAIKSAGNLTQTAAKSSSTSSESVTTHTAGLTASIGAAPTGVGMGLSAGASGSYDETTSKSTSYTNGMISGTDIRIETAGDHNLIGSNIKGNSVSAKIGGNQTITSVQDTSEMDHTRGNWSASVGVAITTDGIIQGTASASASGGKDFDNSKLTAEQAGISADSLDLKVAGNLNLTGAHITSKPGQGSVDVGGKITAQTLQDSRNKDGGYAGGGGGISKNGLPSVTLEFGRVDQVHYIAENAATIDVGDPSKVSAAGGISGPLNTDANKQLSVLQNKRVAGTDVKVEISIGDAQEIVAGVKKLFTPKAGRNVHLADAPRTQTRQGDGNTTKTVEVDAPKATLRSYTDIDAPKVKQTFDQRVVVNTDTTDPVVNKAVQNLASKHPDNTVVVTPTADGGHKVLSGALADSGSKKVEVVGHSDGLKLGGMDSKQITDVVQQLTQNGNSSVDKVALVGCGTACAKDGPSLVSEVSRLLQQQGAATKVKGYDTPVLVDPLGSKRPTQADAADALTKPGKNVLVNGLAVLPPIGGTSEVNKNAPSKVSNTQETSNTKATAATSLAPIEQQQHFAQDLGGLNKKFPVLPAIPSSQPIASAVSLDAHKAPQHTADARVVTEHSSPDSTHTDPQKNYLAVPPAPVDFKGWPGLLKTIDSKPLAVASESSVGNHKPEYDRPRSSAAESLNALELDAIRQYTAGINYTVNNQLRAGFSDNPLIAPLDSAIGKLTSRTDEVGKYYRALPGAALSEGTTFVEPGFLSTASDVSTVREFLWLSQKSAEATIFSKPGADISYLSTYSDENEVLHGRNKSMDVVFKGFDTASKTEKVVLVQSDLPSTSGKKFVMDLIVPGNSITNPSTAAFGDNAAVSGGGGVSDRLSGIVGSTPKSIDNVWTQVGPQLGSNPGGLYQDESGNKWYVKAASSEAHAYNEVLANKLYGAASVDVPEVKLVEYQGKLSVASKFVDGLKEVNSQELSGLRGGKDGFATDAWLANWDVVGLTNDNLLSDGSKAVRVDTGGALEYRANGKPKNELFTSEKVDELHTLRYSWLNPSSAKVFGGMTQSEIRSSIAKVLQVTDETICTLCNSWGGTDVAHNESLAQKLISRKAALEAFQKTIGNPKQY